MDRIIRSLFQINGTPDPEEALYSWNRLQEFELEFFNEDKKIHEYLKKFYADLSAPPDVRIMKDFFEKNDEIEVVSRIDDISKSQYFIRTNFISLVRSEHERQQINSFSIMMREAATIAEFGKSYSKPIDGKKTLKGVQDAVDYVAKYLPDFTRVEDGEKIEGIASEDCDDFINDYTLAEKADIYSSRNLFGFEQVDEACRGHRTGELWTHCASSGELKTTLAVNYLYNNTYLYGKNIFYGILEMPYKVIRDTVYLIHSSHGKFVTEWYEKDKRAGREHPYTGLDYRDYRDGRFDDISKKRMEIVAQDYHATSKGKAYIWKPRGDVTVKDIRRKAETFHNKYECHGVVIDHLGLAVPERYSNDYTVSLNTSVRASKLFALNFARGKGVPLLALFQINRQGKLLADKNDGYYNFSSIAYANEVERSSDTVTYTYLNDALRKDGKFYFGCMKNRGNPIFDRVIGKILWNSKRMREIEIDKSIMDDDNLLKAARKIDLTLDALVALSRFLFRAFILR